MYIAGLEALGEGGGGRPRQGAACAGAASVARAQVHRRVCAGVRGPEAVGGPTCAGAVTPVCLVLCRMPRDCVACTPKSKG